MKKKIKGADLVGADLVLGTKETDDLMRSINEDLKEDEEKDKKERQGAISRNTKISSRVSGGSGICGR